MNRIIWLLGLAFLLLVISDSKDPQISEVKNQIINGFNKKNDIYLDLKSKMQDQLDNPEKQELTEAKIFVLSTYLEQMERDLNNPLKAKCGDICHIKQTIYAEEDFRTIVKSSEDKLILGNNNFINDIDAALFELSVGESKKIIAKKENYFSKIKLLKIENPVNNSLSIKFPAFYNEFGKITCKDMVRFNFSIYDSENKLLYNHYNKTGKQYVTKASEWNNPLFINYALYILHINNNISIIGDKDLMKNRHGTISSELSDIYQQKHDKLIYEIEKPSYFRF